MNKRMLNCDILRILAFVLVILVHSVNYIGFYGTINSGITMLILNILRVFFMACVPLFMVLSGYLMINKTISKKYYLKLFRILLTYLLCSIVCYLATSYIENVETVSLKDFIVLLLDFKAAPYSWYVEMYIGLYLIIPFLNILWKNIDTKYNKNIFMICLFIIFILPTLTNIGRHILPAYWVGNAYPIIYYYLGCYFKEYEVKINIKKILFLLIIIISNGLLTYYESHNVLFINDIYNFHYSFGAFASTILFSIIIFNLKIKIKSEKVNKFIEKISYLTFGAYLLSYIYDRTIYPLFLDYTKYISANVLWLPIIIIIVVLLSLVSSFIVDLVQKLFTKVLKFIIGYKAENSK